MKFEEGGGDLCEPSRFVDGSFVWVFGMYVRFYFNSWVLGDDTASNCH